MVNPILICESFVELFYSFYILEDKRLLSYAVQALESNFYVLQTDLYFDLGEQRHIVNTRMRNMLNQLNNHFQV